ncbi:unnamed protein product [Alopecurus aequalis]
MYNLIISECRSRSHIVTYLLPLPSPFTTSRLSPPLLPASPSNPSLVQLQKLSISQRRYFIRSRASPARRRSMSITQPDLERIAFDETEDPKALPLSLLEEITEGFSDRLEIGRGGFSVVYKGMLDNGSVIAVKRLSSTYMYEKEFQREVECLMRVKHKNIVRFLGYCAYTQADMELYDGKWVMADTQQRLLCFEYLPNGSLYHYIKDPSGGLEWSSRYKIIKGICEGLSYLHHKNILHLDLKPANILLDEDMMPKINDFGLSRCFEEEQTRVSVTKMGGTIGYLAPEFTSRIITHKFDLYSLGMIIIEILTGKRGYQAVENVLENWSSMLQVSQDNPLWQQIKVCAEIGIECTDFEPAKRPPSMKHIVDRLLETESAQVISACPSNLLQHDPCSFCFNFEPNKGLSGPLDIHPLELSFPFECNKSIPCLLHLKNNTDGHVAFNLNDKSQWVLMLPMYGLIPPRSTHSLLVMAQRRKTFPEIGKVLTLQSSNLSNGAFNNLCASDYEDLWKHVNESKNMVHEMKLQVVYTPGGEKTSETSYHGIKIISILDNLGHMFSVDANMNEPWVTFRKSGQAKIATIMDYVTQEQTGTLEATTWGAASSPKFINQREWIIAPSAKDDGHIHVYNYGMEKIDDLKAGHYAITKLAVHPTKLSMLSVCWGIKEIKLWAYVDGWMLSQTFVSERLVNQVVFNPRDTNINAFAISCVDHRVELWDLDSSESTYSVTGHHDQVNGLDFFSREDQQQYLITGSNDKTAKIWDIQTMTCVHTLEGFMSPVMSVFGHPNLPILITGTEDGIIHLWSSSDFRLKRTLNMGSYGEVLSLALACPVESVRVVIGQSGAISIIDFGGEGEWEAE